MSTIISSSMVEKELLSGELWTVGYTTGSIAGAGTVDIGILIGPKAVIYQARTYGGTVTQLGIELHESTWSGGTPITPANRNLGIDLVGPASYAHSITGTPSNLRTGLKIYSAGIGSASVGNVPEGEWYMLEPDTRYILRLTNEGAAAGVMHFRFTYRSVP